MRVCVPAPALSAQVLEQAPQAPTSQAVGAQGAVLQALLNVPPVQLVLASPLEVTHTPTDNSSLLSAGCADLALHQEGNQKARKSQTKLSQAGRAATVRFLLAAYNISSDYM